MLRGHRFRVKWGNLPAEDSLRLRRTPGCKRLGACPAKLRVAKALVDDYVPNTMPLADRSYMRDESPSRNWSITVVILIVNILVFFLDFADGRRSHSAFLEYGALSLDGLKRGFVWQFFTFQFLHGGLEHLIFNSIALYFVGRPLEEVLGKRSFLRLYLLSGLAGGVIQIGLALISPMFQAPMVGASAGICGLFAAFSILSPDSVVYIMFIIPVRARYFLPLTIVLSALFLFIDKSTNVAHGAHLGGTLFGVAYLKWLHSGAFFGGWWERLLSMRRNQPIVKVRFPKESSWQEESGNQRDELESGDFISREVDPILEKISAHGIHSLTERERKILEAARSRMEKR